MECPKTIKQLLKVNISYLSTECDRGCQSWGATFQFYLFVFPLLTQRKPWTKSFCESKPAGEHMVNYAVYVLVYYSGDQNKSSLKGLLYIVISDRYDLMGTFG